MYRDEVAIMYEHRVIDHVWGHAGVSCFLKRFP